MKATVPDLDRRCILEDILFGEDFGAAMLEDALLEGLAV
jgi:hypothetical protein